MQQRGTLPRTPAPGAHQIQDLTRLAVRTPLRTLPNPGTGNER